MSGDRDLEVLWTVPESPGANIAVSLDSESKDRIICFFDAAPGHAAVPAGLIHVLRARSRSKEGTLTIGSHRQVNVPGPGSWYIYVVASHVARKQPFRLN